MQQRLLREACQRLSRSASSIFVDCRRCGDGGVVSVLARGRADAGAAAAPAAAAAPTPGSRPPCTTVPAADVAVALAAHAAVAGASGSWRGTSGSWSGASGSWGFHP